MKGSRVTKKRSFGDELQAALENEHRCSGVEVSMLWGQGLGSIHDRIEALTKKHAPRHPEGFDIYISWTGNDVYGKWRYKAFTWHHQFPWVKETAEMSKKAYEWPIKQLRQVQTDVQKICALANRPGINSITLISGPENGINYGLPEEYDEEMSRHAKVMAEHGVALIDPFPLLQATDRPDRFHTSLTAEHLSTTVNWYKALISATVVNRLVVDLRSEMVANRREVVFYEHFHLNKPDSRLKIPGLKDLLIKPTRDEEVPPVARDDDEQIVLNVPLLAPQQDLPLTEGEDVSEVDRILLDTTPGAENIVQTENETTPQPCSSRSSNSTNKGMKTPPRKKSRWQIPLEFSLWICQMSAPLARLPQLLLRSSRALRTSLMSCGKVLCTLCPEAVSAFQTQ